ncbi:MULTISPECIES: hypothetical protein [unclassified Sulfitobacter]|uniref:hypothetical protein n=1 Tax=Sulfitobacter phage pCB2047-C TaxID=754043 RepID=UPI0002C0D1AE|nr:MULTISPECIES: hypothetical protein [unclassified Sulfitobacter]YP_007675291.1 hypothetical protein SUBG_00034 [Sulfitobacter phage pCB2047-C]YP_007675439.1 hypothetical protein SUAG_00047 [Sulfitobacter phage pCB2047-A]YP_009146241.1 hypothetical protein SUFP_067 [Sulfitobacter phage NYA-2014a]AGG91204.1 hypothetical protein SUBG_00034 [Sulfitobacter phage pCB2047-C]AGH30773.1 hypothetical protein SUAG_00047 [Sulfitobacter phage pCB2047-A]AIM40698.1 hypothetical protein SUFP_067 [Sulfitoba
MTPDEQTVERVAKAINGPHDATHIGAEKLRGLQQHRWDNQTTKLEKGVAISAARAAIAALTQTPQEAEYRGIISDLIQGARRDRSVLSRKAGPLHVIETRVTKGQVLRAVRAISEDSQ